MTVLLTSHRIPILYEEVEDFITSHLQTHVGRTEHEATLHARTVTLFSMAMVQVFADSQYDWSRKYDVAFEEVLLETLQAEFSAPESAALRDIDARSTMPSGSELQARISLAAYVAIGKSGYAGATISRISRRADCSPGAMYKLYPSKEDLAVAAFRDMVHSSWMRVSNFLNILDEGSVSQLIHVFISDETNVHQKFILEFALAGAHNEKLRAVVFAHLEELDDLLPTLVIASDAEREALRYVMRATTALIIGLGWLSTIPGVTETVDFNQFVEPFRRALLRGFIPTWAVLRDEIRDINGES